MKFGLKHKQEQKRRRTPPPQLNIGLAVLLILAIESVALGIKAYDDRRRAVEKHEQLLVSHTQSVAVALKGRADAAQLTLSHARISGWNRTDTLNAYPDFEAVVSLADAFTAPDGSRLRQSAELASRLLANNQLSGLSEAGDIVVVYRPATGPSMLAMIEPDTWTPQTANGEATYLTSSATPQSLERMQGSLTACQQVSQSALSVCNQVPSLTYSLQGWLNLGAYALLLLGSGFALLGMVKMIERGRGESEAFEGQATRAGRILETVLQEAKAGFWSWNFDEGSYWFSPEAAKLIGLKQEGTYRIEDLTRQVHDDHQPAFRQALATLPDRSYISQVFATRDLTTWLDIRARPDETSGEINGILLDVTSMRNAVIRTKQAEQRLRSSLEGFSGPFALWDKHKRLLYWNRAFGSVFGLHDTLRVGMGYDTVGIAQSSGITDRRSSTLEPNSEIVRAGDGDWYKMVERTTSNGGMITLGLDVSADVENEVRLTEQQERLKQLVAELEKSERLAAKLAENLNEEKIKAENSANSKSAFLANMSHELRTPLNAINGFSEILATEMFGPLGDKRYQEYAQDILSSGQHLLDMINDILDMAKAEANKMTIDPRPIDILEPVDTAVRMIRRKAEEKSIKLTLAAQDDLPRVDADHRAIRQMVLNLVSNAIKFTDDGGAVRVTIRQTDQMITVAVKDNGVGIPADALPRLAQPFEQVSDTRDRNYEGTGLGLALTKSFAEMHGGQLRIASEEGRGTQVSFMIPVTQSKPVQPAQSVA